MRLEEAKKLDRGVYVAPWITEDGDPVLIGLTSDRRLVCEPAVVEKDVDPEIVCEWLWGRLDAVDPVRSLAIVR